MPGKLSYLNPPILKVLSRYRDPQLQVCENYWYVFNLGPSICKSHCLNAHFISVLITLIYPANKKDYYYPSDRGVNLFSARIEFRRQNLTSVDVRFWRLKSIPRCKSRSISNGRRPITGIQMNQKELTKTVMMISSWKNTPLASKVFIKNSAL